MNHPLYDVVTAIKAKGILMDSIMVIKNKNKERLLSPNKRRSRKI